MADTRKIVRPLSPHLQIYRPQLTAITSILTRITGNGLIVGTILVVWWLFAAAIGEAYFNFADATLRRWLGKSVLTLSLWAGSGTCGSTPGAGSTSRPPRNSAGAASSDRSC